MKNLFLTLLFCFIYSAVSFSQLRVSANGVRIGDDQDARYILDIEQNSTTEPVAQFGSFGVQSFSALNGFINSNGFWNGSAMQSFVAGKMALIQFVNGRVQFRSTPTVAAGGTSTTLFNHVVGLNDGTNGFTGINEVAPSNTLHVTGNAFKSDGNASWDIPSDARLKRNIQEYDKGLETIMRLQPTKWKYNGRAGTKEGAEVIGLIAQEVQKIAPDMVSEFTYTEGLARNSIEVNLEEGQKETYLKMNTSSLTYMLINAVKEQQAIINDMQKEVEELRNLVGKRPMKVTKETSGN